MTDDLNMILYYYHFVPFWATIILLLLNSARTLWRKDLFVGHFKEQLRLRYCGDSSDIDLIETNYVKRTIVKKQGMLYTAPPSQWADPRHSRITHISKLINP